MGWLQLIGILLGLVNSLVSWAKERQLIEMVVAQELSNNLERSIVLLQKASKARDDALREHDARGGVPDEDDPNLRD